jgi:opacity protein-like surface antigen
MQKTIVTALAILASTAAAFAADLPSKTSAPSAPATPVFVQNQGYIGANLGGNFGSARAYSGGVVAGWNANSFLAVEGTYDLSRPEQKVLGSYNYRNTVALNLVPQYKIPGSDATAYAFGGLGYRWNSSSAKADYSVYNVGAGLRYEFAKNLELDGRYTRVDAVKEKFRSSSSAEDRVTVGVNYKF